MATLSERLRVRSGPKPNYASDGSDSDPDDLVPQNDHTKEVGPLSDLESILDYEFRSIASDEPMASDGVPMGTSIRQYLVKWKNRSYMHCTWVNKLHQRKEATANRGEEFVVIPPEWTTVDRIIASRGKDDGKHYLVKFQGLPYDQCYWEASSNIPTFDKEIQRFEDTNCGSRREHESIQTEFHLFHQSPGFLTGSLHQYQLEGLNFLRFSWSQQRHVILADEMGLGKTIQSIAFLASLFEQNLSPYLVVAPLSTLRNWEREFATWAPHMNVVMYSGTSEARTVIRNHEFYFPKGQVSGQSKQEKIKFDVLLTSYEMINHDAKFLKPIRWSCMIVDEGHRLKNKESKLFGSLKLFTSDHRVLLTGTPLQNNLDELFVLMHFLDAGKFGSLEEFQEEYKDINQEEQISKLHNMLAPHVLRRVKKDVLKEMPPKTELILRVDLTSHQKELYKAVITGNYKILAGRGGAKVSNVLMELRKVCLHPYMVDGVEPPIQDQTEAFRLLLEYSGKLQIVDKMMVKLKEQGHRVLIYSQFQQMLDVLEDYCNYKNWYYERIDGKVGGAERQVRIDRFNAKNSNRFCFLLSTRAGGVGINLATADTVIIYDSDWNPHADLQAIARAHRLGQTNKVMIYRLVSRGTVEEKMLQMAKKKMLLEHIVVGKLKEEKLSQEELDDIIRYGAKEIFSENNEEAGKIHYDDEAIDKLLDRDRVEPEEVSKDDEEDSGFFKAFKVAHFECIDEKEAVAAIEEGQGSGNKSPDRASYWEDLLKDRYEVHQAEELNALGKRKRSCKRVNFSEEDGQANLDLSSDESYETEPCDGKAELDDGEAELDDDEAVEQENQMDRARGTNRTRRRRRAEADGGEAAQQGGNQRRRARGPYITTRARGNAEAIPLLRYEGKNLWVLGFNKRERDTFYTTLMRFGVVDNDWSEFVHPLKHKTLAEIKNYGTLFLKHINEDTEDTPLKYSDIVPKESVNRVDILARIALLALVKKKLKFMEENPTSPLFPNRILYKYSQLRHVHVWKKEHDIILLRAIIKHGYGKWQNIVDEKDLGIQEVICKELSIPELPTYFRDRVKTFVRCRGLLLDKAIRDEHGDEGQIGSSSTHAEQVEPVTNSMDAIVPEETNHNRVFIDLTMEGEDEEAANE